MAHINVSELIPKYDIDWSASNWIRASDIDKTIVEQKFALWDRVIADGLLSSNPEYYALLDDYTIYTYAFLKYENKPIKLRYYQDAVISDTWRFKNMECSNQSGKSFNLCVEGCVDFAKDHGKNFTVILASKSQDLNQNNMLMIKQILEGSDIQFELESDNTKILLRKTESGYYNRIVCTVGGSGIAYAANKVLLDEFEFWTEEGKFTLEYYHDQLFLQRTNATKGSLGIYSNPNGKNFISENLHKRKGQMAYHVYNVNFLDVPGNTIEEWEESKAAMHEIIFASTRAALRVAAEGAALRESDIERTNDNNLNTMEFSALADRKVYFFLDLGFVYDQSVLVGGYSQLEFNPVTKREEIIYYFVPKAYPSAYPSSMLWGFEVGDEEPVPSFVKRHTYEMFDLDLTGKEGNEVSAHQSGLDCIGVKMSGQWKARWYERFISLCKQGRIKVSRIENYLDGVNKDFAYQARSLKISTKTSDGRTRNYPLYHHTTEKDHDDILDAVVGCLSLIDEDMGSESQYDSEFYEYSNNSHTQSADTNESVPAFEDFIKDKDVPSFMSKAELELWYNKRYGL